MLDNLELLEICKKKTDLIMSRIDPESNMRESAMAVDGRYTSRMSEIDNSTWTHSFLTGMIAYMYYHYKDKKYVEFLDRMYNTYKNALYSNLKEVGHDTGFVYALYAVAAYKITGDAKYRELALKAADELSKRFNYEAGVIAAFCRLDEDKLNTIVDDMMNVQLIMWAQSETKHPYYERIYNAQAHTLIKYIIRDDYTVRHAFAFDKKTGEPLTEKNWCGYSCGSAWSRGQAWAIYSLNSYVKHTGNKYLYLPNLEGMADTFIRKIEETDMIPIWDFKIPDYAEHIIDTSAAAIVASAFFSAETDIPKDERHGQFARCGEVSDKIFETLVEKHMADEECENILMNGQCGNLSVGCIWGDYFFVELLMKRIYKDKLPNFWI